MGPGAGGTIVSCALAFLLHRERGLRTDELVALAVAVPLTAMMAGLVPFSGQLLEVLCAAAADPVKQITRAVRASTAATADYDALVRDIRRAHNTIAELSTLAQWLCLKAVLGNGVFMAGSFAFVALEPDPPPGHWWREYHMRWLFVVISLLYLFPALWSLMAPAKVTTACQELGEARTISRRRKGRAARTTSRWRARRSC